MQNVGHLLTVFGPGQDCLYICTFNGFTVIGDGSIKAVVFEKMRVKTCL